MDEPKTKPTDIAPETFIASLDDARKRDDAMWLLSMMERLTGEKGVMWGPSIVGFGSYGYIGSNGKENRWPMSGFSPRKQNLTVYVLPGFESHSDVLKDLGPHSTGVSCLYMKRLDDVDRDVLTRIVKESYDQMMSKTQGGTVALRTFSQYATSDAKKKRDAAKQPATKKSATKKSATKKSATKKTATKKTATKKTATKKSATKKPATKKTATKKKARA